MNRPTLVITAIAAATPVAGKTIVTLHVDGSVPNCEYGTHAHRAVCGADPLDAGGHFEHVPGGATDPANASPSNEIWLDFTTDAQGDGAGRAVRGWTVTPDTRLALMTAEF